MNTENFEIRFYHNNYSESKEFKSSTVCKIASTDPRVIPIIAEETAICHPDDMFCKKIGRLKSFTKCMRKLQSTLDKNQRTELWNGYKSSSNNPF